MPRGLTEVGSGRNVPAPDSTDKSRTDPLSPLATRMEPRFVPLRFAPLPSDQLLRRAREVYREMDARRSVRSFSTRPVRVEALELAIRAAGTAPSGAHQQPWTFAVVSDPELKRQIRAAAEEEERRNYQEGMTPEWLEALAPLGTDFHKSHITDAPFVVVLFKQSYGVRPDGRRRTHYYATESCGIAAGLFIAALHRVGLATLTHTPSPMGFLSRLLRRPPNEKPFLLMPVGYPAPDAQVPELRRKPLEEISAWFPPR